MLRTFPAPARAALALAGGALALLGISCTNGRVNGSFLASGHIEATEVRLATKIPGRLIALEVQEGDRVAEGQEIGRIDTVDIGLTLDTARAERDQTGAELALMIEGPRKEDIAEAEAQVGLLQADLDGAQRELDRMQGLLDAGSGTTKSRDDARTRRDVASGSLDVARERLLRLRAGSRKQEIERARARFAAAAARIAQLEQQIADARITSPVAGSVTQKVVERGELLAAGAVVAVLTDLERPWLTIYVPEPELGRLRLGQSVNVDTDDGQTRAGKVTFVASRAEFTTKNVQTRDERVKLVFKVKIGLENADGLFKPGMPAEARLADAGAGR